MHPPILSIITICFENPVELDATLKSIARHYKPEYVESIVIDGSRDRSCQAIVEQYCWINSVVHEADDGRYDAMNKGTHNARGTYLLFLNSGDLLYKHVNFHYLLKELSQDEGATIFYGHHVVNTGYDLFFSKANENVTPCSFVRGERPSHQAIFLPRSICAKYKYDTNFSISADTKLLIQAFGDLPCRRIDEYIAVFSLGGESSYPRSFFHVFKHWEERRLSRGLSRMNYLRNLLASIKKYLIIKLLGDYLYYKKYLPSKKKQWSFYKELPSATKSDSDHPLKHL